jgi:hypothetical protein
LDAAMADDPRPLILTARLDRAAMARFEALRRAHFPPDRNIVPAHVSLFHQLPGREIDAVRLRLKALARATPAFAADVLPPKSIGNGVAYPLAAPTLVALRAELADAWAPLLIAQDRGRLFPHVTVQNKVSAAAARETLATLAAAFVPWRAQVVGFDIWRYLDGPWEAMGSVALRGG